MEDQLPSKTVTSKTVTRETTSALDNSLTKCTSSNKDLRIIRNSKYKRTRTQFCLFNFVIGRRESQKERKQKHHAKFLAHKNSSMNKCIKHRGKQRLRKPRKYQSKLKKVVIYNRSLNHTSKNQLPSNDNNEAIHQETDLSPKKIEEADSRVSKEVFSRKFRKYCENLTTAKLKELTDKLLRELDRFQKRAYQVNPIKAGLHRRLVIGFREVQMHLNMNKVKLVIIAPDLEECEHEGGIYDVIEIIKIVCRNQHVPYIFSLKRREIAYSLFKKTPISCVGIINLDGARDCYLDLLAEFDSAKESFKSIRNQNTSLNEVTGLIKNLDSVAI